VAPWLHAWAEYVDEDGRWHVADASRAPVTSAAPSTAASGDSDASPPIAVAPDPPTPESGLGHASNPDPRETSASSTLEDPTAVEVATASPPSSPEPDGSPDRWPARFWIGSIALLAGLTGLVLLIVSARRRTRRSFRLDDSGDLSRLLHGALQRPAAFRHLPALFHRKLIPLADGSAISLSHARELAGDGKLYRSLSKARLAAKAVKRRVEVLDDESPEARTVGDTLGATDLDRWSELLARARNLPVLEQVNAYLRDIGERWEVRAIESGNDAVSSLDLRALGVRRGAHRVVLIPSRDPWLLEAEDRSSEHPAMAVLLLLDHLLERLNINPDRRARLLAPQALAAVQEARQ
jgi:hypothetical protein